MDGRQSYSTIRELLPIVGRRVLDVTQHDDVDWLCGLPAFIVLHFDDGTMMRIIVEDWCVFVLPPAA